MADVVVVVAVGMAVGDQIEVSYVTMTVVDYNNYFHYYYYFVDRVFYYY